LKDAIELLAATAVIVPLFRRLNLSPILGFLLAGVLMGPHGFRLVSDVDDIVELAEFGVLFLLFEMGLELSLDRLKKLRVYAFGYGTLQVTVTAIALGVGAYAMGAAVNESFVIGSSLALSSSAFVLSLLAERGERDTKSATAAFGVLLFQDIAVVPLLVLVPLLSFAGWTNLNGVEEIAKVLGITALKALAVLSGAILVGGSLLRRIFELVASSSSSEAFTATVLLTVLGTGYFTEEIGLSMTLGAFVAGVLLAESNFHKQIMKDTEPFRGLLLGLFFITTGMSIDIEVLYQQPLVVLFLITSLIFVKTSIATVLGLPFGLSLSESVKVGLILGQGGEFAFVIFALANKLGFLPEDVDKLLVLTVVISMALTPLLAELGSRLAPFFDRITGATDVLATEGIPLVLNDGRKSSVVVFGYGDTGKTLAAKLKYGSEGSDRKVIIADSSPENASYAEERDLEFVLYETIDAPLLKKLSSSEEYRVSAFVLTDIEVEDMTQTLETIRSMKSNIPVFSLARNSQDEAVLKELGARVPFVESKRTGAEYGDAVLRELDEIAEQELIALEIAAREALEEAAEKEVMNAELVSEEHDGDDAALQLHEQHDGSGGGEKAASNGAAVVIDSHDHDSRSREKTVGPSVQIGETRDRV